MDIGVVLRDYRNYVHPQKELSEKVNLELHPARFEIGENEGHYVVLERLARKAQKRAGR